MVMTGDCGDSVHQCFSLAGSGGGGGGGDNMWLMAMAGCCDCM